MFKCKNCGRSFEEIPKWKRGECPKNRFQHEFNISDSYRCANCRHRYDYHPDRVCGFSKTDRRSSTKKWLVVRMCACMAFKAKRRYA